MQRLPAVAILVVLLAAGLMVPSQAQRLDSPETFLPSPRSNPAVIYDGRFAYVIGGTGCQNFCDDVLRFDPLAETVEKTSGRLPTARSYTAAIWDGQHGYLFGGLNNETYLGDIVRYDPATDRFRTLQARLPPLGYAAAAWDGENAYIFGGCNLARSNVVYRFTPATGALIEMPDRLPTPRCGSMAFWANDTAYVVGGRDDTGRLNQILAYNPAQQTMQVVPSRLTDARSSPGVSYDGERYAYIMGGATDTDTLDSIDRFDTWTQTVEKSPSILPSTRWEGISVWGDNRAYLFGGFVDPGWFYITDQILRFDPDGVPLNRTTDPNAGLNTTDDESRAGPTGDRPPAAWFAYNRNGLNLSVDASASIDPDGNLTHFSWDWGDDSFGEGASDDHQYEAAGAYNVSVTVTDDQGLSNSFQRRIDIGQDEGPDGGGEQLDLPDRPLSRFSFILDGFTITVDGRASASGDGGPLLYRWVWGDGSLPAEGPVASHSYETEGSKRISLTVMDQYGQVHTSNDVVDVRGAPSSGSDGGIALPFPAWWLAVGAVAAIGAFLVIRGYRRGYW